MLTALITALREIVGFRKKAREDKKVGLEIQKLEEEHQRKQSHIEPASFDQVTRFDPQYAAIRRKLEKYVSDERLRELVRPAHRSTVWRRIGLILTAFFLLVLIAPFGLALVSMNPAPRSGLCFFCSPHSNDKMLSRLNK